MKCAGWLFCCFHSRISWPASIWTRISCWDMQCHHYCSVPKVLVGHLLLLDIAPHFPSLHLSFIFLALQFCQSRRVVILLIACTNDRIPVMLQEDLGEGLLNNCDDTFRVLWWIRCLRWAIKSHQICAPCCVWCLTFTLEVWTHFKKNLWTEDFKYGGTWTNQMYWQIHICRSDTLSTVDTCKKLLGFDQFIALVTEESHKLHDASFCFDQEVACLFTPFLVLHNCERSVAQ